MTCNPKDEEDRLFPTEGYARSVGVSKDGKDPGGGGKQDVFKRILFYDPLSSARCSRDRDNCALLPS